MGSKSFKNRIKQARALEKALEVHLKRVAPRLQRAFEEDLEEGEEAPDAALVLRLLRRRLARARRALVETEDAHFHEERHGIAPRRERDEAAAEVYQTLLRAGRAIDAAYGRGRRLQHLGFRRLRRDPVAIELQADITLGRLRSHAPPDGVLTFDADALADELEQALERLRAVLSVVGLEVSEREATQMWRKRAREAYDETYGVVGRAAEGLYDLAGEKELRKRLRRRLPSPRRRRPAEDRPATGEPEPATPTEPESTESD